MDEIRTFPRLLVSRLKLKKGASIDWSTDPFASYPPHTKKTLLTHSIPIYRVGMLRSHASYYTVKFRHLYTKLRTEVFACYMEGEMGRNIFQ